jgi:hypothetical protein
MSEHIATIESTDCGGVEVRIFETAGRYVAKTTISGPLSKVITKQVAWLVRVNAAVYESGVGTFTNMKTHADMAAMFPMPVPMSTPIASVLAQVVADGINGRVTYARPVENTWKDDPPGTVY